jgi:hypothetical protein
MGVSVYPRKEATVLTTREAGWVLGPFWTGVEKRKRLAKTRVQTPNRPACNLVTMPAPLKLRRRHYATELKRRAM